MRYIVPISVPHVLWLYINALYFLHAWFLLIIWLLDFRANCSSKKTFFVPTCLDLRSTVCL